MDFNFYFAASKVWCIVSYMKYTLHEQTTNFWNGIKPLPAEINVISHQPHMGEFELLSIICVLHGYITAFDILLGADSGTEKDKDIIAVTTAFQSYLLPKMPLSNYTSTDERLKPAVERKRLPIDPSV